MIDEKMIRHMERCTQTEGNRVKGTGRWNISLNELKTFFALLYARGVLSGSTLPRRSLWSQKWGIEIFQTSMTRDFLRKFYALFDLINAVLEAKD